MLYSYLDLNFDALHAATGNRCAHGNHKKIVNLGPIALLCSYKLTNSSGKLLEDISLSYVVSLMCKLTTSTKEFDDLSVGFDQDRNRKQRDFF